MGCYGLLKTYRIAVISGRELVTITNQLKGFLKKLQFSKSVFFLILRCHDLISHNLPISKSAFKRIKNALVIKKQINCPKKVINKITPKSYMHFPAKKKSFPPNLNFLLLKQFLYS